MSTLFSPSDWVICDQCDALYRRASLEAGHRACCRRCGHTLYGRTRELEPRSALALSLTAFILFLLANVFPVLGMELAGQHREMPLWMAIHAMWMAGQPLVAMLAAATMWLFPLLIVLLYLLLLGTMLRGVRPPAAIPMLHLLRHLQPWSMLEVFMIGIVVSLVKLGDIAEIILGPGLGALALLTLLLIRLGTLDRRLLWNHAAGGRS